MRLTVKKELVFTKPRTGRVHSLFSHELKVFTEALPHPRHPQTPTVPGEPLRTTYWSASSSGSGRAAGPFKQVEGMCT